MRCCRRRASAGAITLALTLALAPGILSASYAQAVPGGPFQGSCNEIKAVGGLTVTFTGVDYSASDGTSTWNYRLEWTQPGIGALHFIVGACGDLTAADLVSTTPAGGVLGFDSASGIYGVKWSNLSGGSPIDLSFTVREIYGVGSAAFSTGFGSTENKDQICGMTCEEICVVDLDCPPDVTVDCTESTAPSNTGQAQGFGLCSAVTVTHTDAVTPGNCAGSYTIQRTWRATDAAGNAKTCVQLITVEDTKPPTFSGCGDSVSVSCIDEIPPVGSESFNVTDDCSDFDLVHVEDVTLSEGCPTVIERTYRATDRCGNSAECSYVIVVKDETAPTITCPEPLTVECDQPVPQPIPNSVQYRDECEVVLVEWVGDFPEQGTCPQVIRRVYKATDWCGNEAQCEQIITIVDTTPPTLQCPQDLTLECGSSVDPGVTGTATAGDACGDVTINYSDLVIPSQLCPQNSIIVRTWTAVDECGNESTCDQTITIVDSTPPAIICPLDTTVQCGEPTDPSVTGTAEADDVSGEVTISFNDVIAPGGPDCPQGSVITRTWTAEDECGNSARCSQAITIVDTTPPTIQGPEDITVECGDPTDPSATGTAVGQDNCGAVTISYTDDVAQGGPDCPQGSVITRTWTASDECGNSATYYQVITVVDTTAPIIVCPDTIWVACDESPPEPDPGSAQASDNCGAVTVTHEGDSNEDGVNANGAITQVVYRTYRATDECGNYAECRQVIVLGFDNEPPTIVCPPKLTLECDSELEDFGFPEYSDNCDQQPVISFTDVVEQGQRCPQDRRILRTWTVTDANGNKASCVQKITFLDTTPPVFAGPDTLLFDCSQGLPDPYKDGIEAKDNCGEVTLTWLGDFIPDKYFSVHKPGDNCLVACVNYVGRRYQATDECGNAAEHIFIIVILDTTQPSIECPPGDEVACVGDIPKPDPSIISADDDCHKGVVTFVGDVSDGNKCPKTITRTYRATDECGNYAECRQIFVVNDDVAPTIACPGSLRVECDQRIPAPDVSLVEAEDNCGGSVTVVHVSDVPYQPNKKTRLASGEGLRGVVGNIIIRTYRATDECGNYSECEQVIVLDVDRTPPDIICPDDITLECSEVCSLLTVLPEVRDDCDPQPFVELVSDSLVPGQCPQEWARYYRWRATDASGNSAECVQVIRIEDTTPPEIKCPPNVTAECDDLDRLTPATATDNCDPEPEVTYQDRIVDPDAECPPPACYITIERTWTATDDCGNSSSCVQYIRAEDSKPPVIACSPCCLDAGRYEIDATGGVVITVECDKLDELKPPAVTDNCDPNPTLTYRDFLTDGEDGDGGDGEYEPDCDCPQNYNFNRKWTAEDACGNESTCWWAIRVRDTTPPVLTCAPDTSIPCDSEVVFTPPVAVDNCDPVAEIVAKENWTEEGPGPGEVSYVQCWIAKDDCGNKSPKCCQRVTVRSCSEPCTFTMWEWGACCTEDEAQNPRSTLPACIRDRHFSEVFPNGVLVGDPGGIAGGDPNAYAALWTSSAALQAYLPAFGTPGPLTGDLVNPVWTPSGTLCGRVLTLRLNREYSCAGILADLCFTTGVVCLGDYVIPQSCGLFAGMTVDEFLAIADQVVAGNLEVLDEYNASADDVKTAAQCLNVELSGCVPDCGDMAIAMAVDGEGDGESEIGSAQSDLNIRPVNFVVYQSYPNPFGTRANIRFGLPTDGWVTIQVFNATGRKIATVLDAHKPAGFHVAVWDGRDDRGYVVPSGVYFYRVQSGGDYDVKKMILSR